MENETRLGGWVGKLHRLSDLRQRGWCSGSAAPVRLYFIRDERSRQGTEWMDVTFGYSAALPVIEPVPEPQSLAPSRDSPAEVLPPCNINKRPLILGDNDIQPTPAKRKRTTSRRKRCPLRDENGKFIRKS